MGLRVVVSVGSSAVAACDAIGVLDQELDGANPADRALVLISTNAHSSEAADVAAWVDQDRWPVVERVELESDADTRALIPRLGDSRLDGTLTWVLLPAGGTELDARLAILSDRAGFRLLTASGPEATLVSLLDDSAPPDRRDAGVEATLECWRWLPHAARIHALDPTASWINPREADEAVADDVERSIDAMRERTRKWVDGDLWQADLLPHMVHHGKFHGRRVDRLATDLLLMSPLLGKMPPPQRLSAVSALSAAAWLHDVGQQGGTLDTTYVREYVHVRKFHGVLSHEAIMKGGREFDLPDGLRFLVAQLCKCHQRNSRLSIEIGKAPEPCRKGCPICEAAYDRLQASLADEMNRQAEPAVATDFAVALGAILRVSDAADIGIHRVNGRWATKNKAVDQVWRREYVQEQLLRDSGKFSDKAEARLYRLLVRDHWLETDLVAMEKALTEEGAGETAERVRKFDVYLEGQREHVDKHRLFGGSQIRQVGDEKFEIEVLAGDAWNSATEDERNENADAALKYIWSEYHDSEVLFGSGLLPRLVSVKGPGGASMTAEEAME